MPSGFGLLTKYLLPFFLFCLGALGPAVGAAQALSQDGKVYKSAIAPDGIQHVPIDGGSYFFRPNRIMIRVNVPVELAVSVEGDLIPHSFVIQAPEAGMMVDESLSTKSKTIRFTPTAIGKYAFYCKNKLLFFKSHREKGMEGMLEVVE